MGFFSRLKKEVWKVIRFFLILAVLIGGTMIALRVIKREKRPDHVRIFLDSDSANEIDDLFAISAVLTEPRMELIALSSAQWHAHPDAPDSSVLASQKINSDLLRLFGRNFIPHPLGGNGPVSYWGDPNPVVSPAAMKIISEAHKVKEGEKLIVVTIGGVTNLASAIIMDSTLTEKISWYAMGLWYDPAQGIWNKNEFNVRNDLDAMDYLLNLKGLEAHFMTATTSQVYRFSRQEIWDNMINKGPEWDYLTDRWMQVCPEDNERTMWDLALIQAILYPDLVKTKEAITPPENTRRRVTVYTWLDKERLKKEYFNSVKKYIKKHAD
ncbi:MAG: nucleoside hydrolase [Bacteroidota bacterium]